MGEPGDVRNKVTEAGNLRADSMVTIATMTYNEAPALLARLPFSFFYLSHSALTLHQALFEVLERRSETKEFLFWWGQIDLLKTVNTDYWRQRYVNR